MKTLTAIAKDNNIKYRQFRDKLVELKIIYKYKKRYIPTRLALEAGIAKESGRFGNKLVMTISYHYHEQKILDHYYNCIKLIVPQVKEIGWNTYIDDGTEIELPF